MPSLALADALPDFGSANPIPSRVTVEDTPRPRKGDGEPPHAGTQRANEVAEAVANAEAALTERLQKKHEEKLAAERERHEQELKTLQQDLGDKASETIAARFSEMEQQVTDLTAGLTARILGAALSEDLQKRAVEHLAQVITDAMNDREAVRISVRGTAFLGDQLRSALGERASQIEFIEAPGLDLSAKIDESIVETRLAEWAETLSEVLS